MQVLLIVLKPFSVHVEGQLTAYRVGASIKLPHDKAELAVMKGLAMYVTPPAPLFVDPERAQKRTRKDRIDGPQ